MQCHTKSGSHTITYQRNADGQITQQTDPEGKITRYRYDPDGRC